MEVSKLLTAARIVEFQNTIRPFRAGMWIEVVTGHETNPVFGFRMCRFTVRGTNEFRAQALLLFERLLLSNLLARSGL